MIDEPYAVTLLEAMAATLTERVMPALEGGVQHEARVVANLCRILARELATDPDRRRGELADLLGLDTDLAGMVADLDAAIRAGSAPADTLEFLLADAARRAEVTRPGYAATTDAT